MSEAAHILVVDDNEMNRDMLSRRLLRKGFKVTVATGGNEALTAVEADSSFDLILLDLHMPEINGLEVLSRVREKHSQLELPIVMVTADTDSEAVVDALGRGANDYVTKPINFPVVLARIHGALTLKRTYTSQMQAVREAKPEPKTRHLDNRYELQELIGEGGFAVVYKARQVSTGQTVAIKLLRSHRLQSDDSVEHVRFQREMTLIGRIQHPNIVNLIDSGQMPMGSGEGVLQEPMAFDSQLLPDTVVVNRTEEKLRPETGESPQMLETQDEFGIVRTIPYIVMEFLDGETLAERLERQGKLGVAEAIEILLPVMSAVDCAHRHGVIHRDLKPANIVLARIHDGTLQPRVLDFGVAKLVTEDDPKQLTVTMSVIGTPNYMSPEQARSQRNLTEASDQFTMGVLLYECVTGRRPYQAEGFLSLIQEVARGDIVPPRLRNPKLPLELERIIMKAMSLQPEDRFSSVAELALTLQAFVGGEWSMSSTTDVPAIVIVETDEGS